MSKTPSIDVRFRANKYELDIFAILESIPADIKNEFIKECIVEHTKAVVNGKQKSRILSRQVLCNELTDKQADLSFYVPSRDMILSEMERDYLSPKAPAKEFVYVNTVQEQEIKQENNKENKETQQQEEVQQEEEQQQEEQQQEEQQEVQQEETVTSPINDNDNNNDDDNDDNDDNDDDNMGEYMAFGMQGTSIFN